eukprot:1116824-Rhodomonas_salina.3
MLSVRVCVLRPSAVWKSLRVRVCAMCASDVCVAVCGTEKAYRAARVRCDDCYAGTDPSCAGTDPGYGGTEPGYGGTEPGCLGTEGGY